MRAHFKGRPSDLKREQLFDRILPRGENQHFQDLLCFLFTECFHSKTIKNNCMCPSGHFFLCCKIFQVSSRNRLTSIDIYYSLYSLVRIQRTDQNTDAGTETAMRVQYYRHFLKKQMPVKNSNGSITPGGACVQNIRIIILLSS